MQSDHFHLKIQERAGILYEGDVLSITSLNEAGEFDILPDHANFISLIKGKVILREAGKDEKEIAFDNALIRASNNLVEIYIGVEGVFGDGNNTPE